MLISQVIDMARAGELSNLSDESFTDAKIISYINLGLIELYKRFQLRTAEALITMVADETNYLIDGTDINVKLEADAPEVMAILEAYDESGAMLNINVENDEYGIMTPEYDLVQIPNPSDGEKIGILYLAAPTYITTNTQKLKLPMSLLEAILHYIGYRAHGSVDGNVQAENNTHYQRFEASVARAKMLGVVTQDDIADRSTTGRFV